MSPFVTFKLIKENRMSPKNTSYLKDLEKLLENEGKSDSLFPCVRDIVANGLVQSRFGESDFKPNRQDITQHLLSWFYYIRVPRESCRKWIMSFCTGVLAELSSSSPSQIKHSTRSNIKYIYNSEVSLNCNCEDNMFKADCSKSCPAYGEMKIRGKEKLERDRLKASGVVEKYEPPVIEPHVSVGQKYKEQFEEALALIRKGMEERKTRKEILTLLIQNNYVTRTGKKWSTSILGKEIRIIAEEDPELKNNYNSGQNAEKKPSLKQIYAEQFQEAMKHAREKKKKGASNAEIAGWLNNQGYKTRSGKKWTNTLVYSELKKFKPGRNE